MKTWTQLKNIRDAMKSRIEAAALNVQINGVIVGGKGRLSDFNPPLVWLVPSNAAVIDESMALNEYWKPRYLVIGVVQSYEPEEGMAQAEELALRASAALLFDSQGVEDRTLDGNCLDLARVGFSPAADRITNDGALYGAAVEIEVRFNNQDG